MNNPGIKIYLLNETETLYYYGFPTSIDSAYGLAASLTEVPIVTLPNGWEDTEISWERHPEYLGVFRSQTQKFKFVEDARWILMILFYAAGGGIQQNVIMRIDKFIDTTVGYQTVYKSELDFSQLYDGKYNAGSGSLPEMTGELEIPTLDSKLYTYLKSFGNTDFNFPMWKRVGTAWIPNDGVDFVQHNGIKLLYNATFISSATPTTPLQYPDMRGFHHGNVGDSCHTIPNLNQYNIIQNNGSTTFIGNDILAPFLIQGNQNPGSLHVVNEIDFSGTNNSQPHTRNNFSLKNLLPSSTGAPGGLINMNFRVTGQFQGDITVGGTSPNPFIGFVIFKIDESDDPPILAGSPPQLQYLPTFYKYILPPSPFSAFTPPDSGLFDSGDVAVSLEANKVYVISIIHDGIDGDGIGVAAGVNFNLSALQVTFKSLYDSGESGLPIAAPQLNSSVFPSIRLLPLLQKLVKYLDTTLTDGYGFPIEVPTDFIASSSFLSDPSINVGDCCPSQIKLTSSYCIHDLQGQSYLSISLNKLFNFCKKSLGCGLHISDDGNRIGIERLSAYFDRDLMIINLDDYSGVASLKISPYLEGIGCNLKLGYTKADTNSDFGVDPFNTELFFNTPLNKVSSTIDYEETDILTEQYAIEKIRAQKVNQPIGASYDPANPSGDNTIIALYCQPFPSPFAQFVSDPSNTIQDVNPFIVNQRSNAQNLDPTAAAAPYIYGMYYPDTAINVELSPCRTLQRDNGAMLHSVLDLYDSEMLTFRNTFIMQYNNTVLALSGMESNLKVGSGAQPITEFKDIRIGTLPNKLFRPFIFDIQTVAPVNMYSFATTNNLTGYIQFTWKKRIFKGFIMKISQKLGASAPTNFKLLAHPDTTNNDLIFS